MYFFTAAVQSAFPNVTDKCIRGAVERCLKYALYRPGEGKYRAPHPQQDEAGQQDGDSQQEDDDDQQEDDDDFYI
jgi:hypothetical protein